MQWIIFSILAMVVVSGVRKMAREGGTVKPFSNAAPEKNSTTSQPAAQIQETVQCSKCGAYRVKNAPSCGKADCPFGK
jgi:hypothetical protein